MTVETASWWSELREAARGATTAPPGSLRWIPGEGWRCALPEQDPRRPWLDLYLPICNGGRDATYVIGHLGQSLDGFIATPAGDSNFVTGGENIRHLHRLRALCDAVIVGATTVAADDPRLTTRLVEGASPLRIVLDPRRRLGADHRIFSDHDAPTLRVVQADAGTAARDHELAIAADSRGRLDLVALLQALRERGLRRLFVEGGGATVSAFLEAQLLDRLHIAIAPLIIGEGRPALRLPPHPRLGDCMRPPVRVFRMGEDVLYDFDLRCAAREPASPAAAPLARVY